MNIICGINAVFEALAGSSRHFDRLLVVKGIRNQRVSDVINRASQRGIPLRFEPREALDRLAAGVPHQGVIAVVSAKPVVELESVLEHARDPALLLLLDGVEDPRNLGAILRTAEAAGVDGVVIPERHSVGLTETVARASAGGLEHVRVARVGNLTQAVEQLKQRGVWVVGFDAAGTERWDAVDYRRPVALVLGGEGRGIRRLVREHCDHLVSLPLFGHVGSLNVSVAAGVALYEVIRQRGVVPSHVRPIRPGGQREEGTGDPPAARGHDEAPDSPLYGRVRIHEESAWSAGSWPREERRPRDERSRRVGPESERSGPPREKRTRTRPQPKPEGEAPDGRAARDDRSGGDRPPGPRRGRRRRRSGPPNAGGPPSQPSVPSEAPPAEGVAEEPASSGEPGHRRRRRRRRR